MYEETFYPEIFRSEDEVLQFIHVIWHEMQDSLSRIFWKSKNKLNFAVQFVK